MLCHACKTPLTMSERSGIEIDYCSTCRGVWLDRGELDKIIERSAAAAPAPSAPPPPSQPWSGHPHHGSGYPAPCMTRPDGTEQPSRSCRPPSP